MSPPETLVLRGQYDAIVTVTAADSPYHVNPSFPHQLIFADTTDDDIVIVLPENPPFGTMITVVDLAGNVDTGDDITITGQPDYPATVRDPNGINGLPTLNYQPPGPTGQFQYKAFTLFFYGRSPRASLREPIKKGYRIIWNYDGIQTLAPLVFPSKQLGMARARRLHHG